MRSTAMESSKVLQQAQAAQVATLSNMALPTVRHSKRAGRPCSEIARVMLQPPWQALSALPTGQLQQRSQQQLQRQQRTFQSRQMMLRRS